MKSLLILSLMGFLAPAPAWAAWQEKPKSPKPVPPKRVLTNEDFGGGRSTSKAPPTAPPAEPTSSAKRPAASLTAKARELTLKIESLRGRIEMLNAHLAEIAEEDKPVFAGETKPGRTYLTARGPGGLVVYLPVKTGEERQVRDRLAEAQADLDRATIELEQLREEARRAGYTLQQVLDP